MSSFTKSQSEAIRHVDGPLLFLTNHTDRINAKELMTVIKKLYAEYEVPAYMQDCTYFYQQKWIFSMKNLSHPKRLSSLN